MIHGLFIQALCLAGLALTGCIAAPESRQVGPEWHRVESDVGTIDVALLRPSEEFSGPRPVLLALPWGSGSPELVSTFVQSYWRSEPAARGYYVVSPAVRGSSLETTAPDVLSALFDWMEAELTIDEERVALVGASNGGRGIFFAALAAPDRFHALMGLPGSYGGDPASLAALSGKPIRLLVGEFDDPWVSGAEATVSALATHGITAELEVVPGEGHVMRLDPASLLDWIDEALRR